MNPCANCPNSWKPCAPCTRPDLNPAARTCANCAQSKSADPKCGLCTGPTTTTTRWEPIK